MCWPAGRASAKDDDAEVEKGKACVVKVVMIGSADHVSGAAGMNAISCRNRARLPGGGTR